MKESEAIERLKNMRLFMQITDKNSEHKFAEDDYKTNEIAIKALEKQTANGSMAVARYTLAVDRTERG